MGVLGWTPETLRDVRLCDLADAWRGYAEMRGAAMQEDILSRSFLDDMTKRFPDRGKDA